MNSPEIDARDINSIVKKIEELVPFYTPEWKFSKTEQEPGTALVMSCAQMLEGIIKRFNRVPDKNYIAFLNMLGVEQLPAQPSRAPVTFKLANGAVIPVMAKERTLVSAEGEDKEGPVLFETENNMLVTPAKFVEAYNVSIKEDKIIQFPEAFFLSPKDREKQDLGMFETYSGENLQQHAAYFSHDDLLTLRSPSCITLNFKNSAKKYKETNLARKLTDSQHAKWEYWGEINGITAWHPFDSCKSLSDEVVLVKEKEGWLTDTMVNGVTAKWIRCTAASLGMETLSEIEFDKAFIRADYYEEKEKDGGISPDLLFYNDKTLELMEFYPYSEYFVMGDAFYMANREVLSKKGAWITLSLDIKIHELQMVTIVHEIKWKLIMKQTDVEEKEPKKTNIKKVVWEYWNGIGWARLQTDKSSEAVFSSGDGMKTVKFKCPDDIGETFVNNYPNLWIRAQISKIDNMYVPGPKFCSPFINSIKLRYQSETAGNPVQNLITYNNMDYKTPIMNFSSQTDAFKPFYFPEQTAQSFYMGFDSPPMSGPISVFFSILERKHSDEGAVFEWEYLREKRGGSKWEGLKVVDRTNSFTKSGTLVFVGPEDFAKKTLFGKELYWIRVVNSDRKLEDSSKRHLIPRTSGIFMNTTWAIQQETINKGILETLNGKGNLDFKIYKTPVFDEEVWINEKDSLTEEDQRRLLNDKEVKTDLTRDGRGEILEFWVKWTRVEDFYDSFEEDRNYVLDPSTGLISFGDDKNGKKPVTYEGNNIKISYRTGGGSRGNIEAFGICNLQSSLSYIDEVYNAEPAMGGSDMEHVDTAIKRGPEVLKNRNRAVTAEDIESLTKQVSQSITRVKCLPNVSQTGKSETGWFTVVIAPLVESIYQRPSTELKEKALKYIMERTSGHIAFSKHVQVIEPLYVEISLFVTLVCENMEAVTFVEKDALDKINAFLSPTTGNYGGTGWEIGQIPHLSMFYSLLKSVEGVNYVEKVSMTANILNEGKLVEIDPNRLGEFVHMLVVNGCHKVAAGVQT